MLLSEQNPISWSMRDQLSVLCRLTYAGSREPMALTLVVVLNCVGDAIPLNGVHARVVWMPKGPGTGLRLYFLQLRHNSSRASEVTC